MNRNISSISRPSIASICSRPFFFASPPEDDNYSTSSSLQRSRDQFPEEATFMKELDNIRLMKNLKEKPTITELKPAGMDRARFSKLRARSNSPVRDSLSIINRNHPIFPPTVPIAVVQPEIPGLSFDDELYEFEEDDDLQALKSRYSQLLEENDDVGDDDSPVHPVSKIQCKKNNLTAK